jgi:hypothetical protein
MAVDPANVHELAEIAGEVGADVLSGALRYPSDTGGWLVGDLDLSEYLDHYRDQRLVLIIAPIGQAEPATYTCGVCGFVMNEVGECPRCKLAIQEGAAGLDSWDDTPDILDQVDRLLRKLDGDYPHRESI